jgi:hypothetical protein
MQTEARYFANGASALIIESQTGRVCKRWAIVCHMGQFGVGGRLHPLKPGVAIGLIEGYAVHEKHMKMNIEQ